MLLIMQMGNCNGNVSAHKDGTAESVREISNGYGNGNVGR